MEQVVKMCEVMRGFPSFSRDVGEGEETGVDGREVKELAGVVAAETSDKVSSVKVAEEEKFRDVASTCWGDRRHVFIVRKRSTDDVNLFYGEGAGF